MRRATLAPKRPTLPDAWPNFAAGDSEAHLAVHLPYQCAISRHGRGISRPRMRYRLLGGFSFYQRAEVKDALAYVRLALFPEDDVALLRVLNTPPRGIGKTTVEALRAAAREHNRSLWEALGEMVGRAKRAVSRRCAASAN